MLNQSIWSIENDNSQTESLKENIYVDVLIIGGGITGISSAYHLSKKGLRIALVEKDKIGSGTTSRSTAKLTYLQENIYSKIYQYHGLKKTKLYYNSQKDAINLVINIINKEKIDCNLEKVKSYLFDVNNKKLEKEYHILNELGINLKTDLINNVKGYYVDDTYVFHPLKYLSKLKKRCLRNEVKIYEYTKIKSFEKEKDYYICRTKNNFIKTKYIIIASHYPYFLIPFFLPMKSYIEKSYIKAFKVNNNRKLSAINITKPRVSLRYYQDGEDIYEIYLSNTHNLSLKHDFKDCFNYLIKKHDITPNFIWSNTDIMTNDSLPFIGPISKDKQILLATGYNTWGMTNGSLAGKILADYILKIDNPYLKLFNPYRPLNIGKIINLPNIILGNIYSFSTTKLLKNKAWYSNNLRIVKINGKNIGIYTDDKKKEHKVYTTCPHLKCSLIFNELEKVWECPCHSSRFDIDGNVIDGPSNYNIAYKE